jgi:hypothetical protein
MKIDIKFYKIFLKTNENNVSFETVIVTEVHLIDAKKLSTVWKRNLCLNFISFQAIKELILKSDTRIHIVKDIFIVNKIKAKFNRIIFHFILVLTLKSKKDIVLEMHIKFMFYIFMITILFDISQTNGFWFFPMISITTHWIYSHQKKVKQLI